MRLSICGLAYGDQCEIAWLKRGQVSIGTEGRQFRAPDFDEMQSRLSARVIVDGRNLFHPDCLRADGWSYYSVGRA